MTSTSEREAEGGMNIQEVPAPTVTYEVIAPDNKVLDTFRPNDPRLKEAGADIAQIISASLQAPYSNYNIELEAMAEMPGAGPGGKVVRRVRLKEKSPTKPKEGELL